MLLLDRLYSVVSAKTVITAFLIWIVAAAALFTAGPYATLQSSVDTPLLEERFGYSGPEANEWFHSLSDAGQALYWSFQWLDLANAFVMATALFLAIVYILKRFNLGNSPGRLLLALPVVILLCEWIENGLILMLLSQHPKVSIGLVGFASSVTTVKLFVTFTTLPLVRKRQVNHALFS